MLSPGSILPPVDFKHAFKIVLQFFYFFWKKRHLLHERVMICYFRHYKHYLWSKADDQRAKPLVPRVLAPCEIAQTGCTFSIVCSVTQSAYVPLLEVQASSHESNLIRYSLLGTCAYIASVQSPRARQVCFSLVIRLVLT